MAFNPAFSSLNSQNIKCSSSSVSTSNNNESSTSAMDSEMFRFLSGTTTPMAFPPPFGHFPPVRFDGLNTTSSFGSVDPTGFRRLAPNGLPFGTVYHPALASDLKSGPDQLSSPGVPSGFFYDPAYPFGGPLDLNGARRKNATRETTAALKHWLYEHRKNPYPTKGEKIMLAIMTKMTLTQVSTWFANARRRLKKENKMTWSPKNRQCDDDDDDNRPTSSLSGISDGNVDSQTVKDESLETNKRESTTPSTVSSEGLSPVKKPKIWSIIETLASPLLPENAARPANSPPSSSSSSTSIGPPVPPWTMASKSSVQFGAHPPSLLPVDGFFPSSLCLVGATPTVSMPHRETGWPSSLGFSPFAVHQRPLQDEQKALSRTGMEVNRTR